MGGIVVVFELWVVRAVHVSQEQEIQIRMKKIPLYHRRTIPVVMVSVSTACRWEKKNDTAKTCIFLNLPLGSVPFCSKQLSGIQMKGIFCKIAVVATVQIRLTTFFPHSGAHVAFRDSKRSETTEAGLVFSCARKSVAPASQFHTPQFVLNVCAPRWIHPPAHWTKSAACHFEVHL